MPIYRTTQSSLTTGVMTNLQKSLDRLGTTQAKLSSGKEVSKPSDSPVATASAMRYRADMKATEQHLRNASDAQGWLGTADNALTGSLESIRRVKELALSGMNATTTPEAASALAAEVDSLRKQMISVANTKYLDRSVFSGNNESAGLLAHPVLQIPFPNSLSSAKLPNCEKHDLDDMYRQKHQHQC